MSNSGGVLPGLRHRGSPWVFGAVLGLLVLLSWAGTSGAAGPAGHALRSAPPTRADTLRAPSNAVHGGPAASFVLGMGAITPAAISLNWTDPGDAFFHQYAVDESTNGSGGPWSTVGVVTSATSTQWTVASLSPGATYSWEVVETYGFLTQSTRTSNTLNATQATLPVLSATGVSGTSATFHWTNAGTYGGGIAFGNYSLFVEIGGGSPSRVQTLSNLSDRNYTDSSLTAGTSYTFYEVTEDCVAGCGSGGAVYSSSQSNSLPLGTAQSLAVSITAARSVVDVAESDYFTCTPSGGNTPYTFSWDFGNGTLVSGLGGASVSFSSAGGPTVTCQVTDGARVTSSAALTVVVNARPQVLLEINRTSADVGQPVQFNCSTTNGTAPFVTSWNLGDGATFNGLSVAHTYQTAGGWVATCEGFDGAGVPVANSSGINVSEALGANASVSSLSAAPGTSLSFNASGSGGRTPYTSFAWTFVGLAGPTGPAVRHSFTATGDSPAVLRVTDSNGMTATASLTVSVSFVSVQVTSAPSSARTGSLESFSAQAQGGAGGPYNYTWNFGDGTRGYGALVGHTFLSAGTFSPTLTVTDRLGAQNVSRLTPVDVTPLPGPLAWLTASVVLLLSGLLGALFGALFYLRSRAAATEDAERLASYVPPTDPSKTVSGSKICRYCETPNLPIRKTCVSCGKPLPRTVRR